MYRVKYIVKNKDGKTVGYDVQNVETGIEHYCVPINDLLGYEFENAEMIIGRSGYLRSNRKERLPVRYEKGILPVYKEIMKTIKNRQ